MNKSNFMLFVELFFFFPHSLYPVLLFPHLFFCCIFFHFTTLSSFLLTMVNISDKFLSYFFFKAKSKLVIFFFVTYNVFLHSSFLRIFNVMKCFNKTTFFLSFIRWMKCGEKRSKKKGKGSGQTVGNDVIVFFFPFFSLFVYVSCKIKTAKKKKTAEKQKRRGKVRKFFFQQNFFCWLLVKTCFHSWFWWLLLLVCSVLPVIIGLLFWLNRFISSIKTN